MQQILDWQRVKDVFAGALEREPQSRARFLADVCANDDELRREVESLLLAHEKSHDFIEQPPLEMGIAAAAADDADSTRIERAGAYRIVKEIGRGGMGVVYEAVRDDEFRQRVAVKIIKRGLDTDAVVQRFRRERQILARLEHPHIARFLDGGTTADAVPYFVMEYVEGVSLLDYSAQNRLGVHERLQLFRLVCRAVEYAHRNLIVHRDLKPSNILVTRDGAPKLLDFGVSKLLQPDAADQTETAQAQRVFTPEYASPEQINGAPATTASDVYSLGVILYELLTGTRPFRFVTNDFDEIARVVGESAAPKPSVVVQQPLHKIQLTTDNDEKRAATSKKRLAKRLKGDLDNIVLKAIHKDQSRRYESVAALNEDIRRHLADLPVAARQDGFGYRAAKFIRRRQAAVVAGSLILLVLGAGAGATVWQANVAREQARIASQQAEIARAERDKAEFAQERAERINDFFEQMLASARPDERGRDAKVVDVLERAEQAARRELSDRPEVLASVMRAVGNTYKALAQYDAAENSLRLALLLSEQLEPQDSRSVATFKFELADVLQARGNSREAESLLREAIEIYRRFAPDSNQELAAALGRLGATLRDRDNRRASDLLNEALALSRQTSGANSLETLAILHDLALLRGAELDAAGEIEIYNQIIPILRRQPARRANLATALLNQGAALMNENRLREADACFAESLALHREIYAPDNVNTAAVLTLLARLRLAQNQAREAQSFAEQALAMQKRLLRADDPALIGGLSALGEALTAQNKAARGEPFVRQALDLVRQTEAAESWIVGLHESRLGACLLRQKQFTRAEPLLLDGWRKIIARFEKNHRHAAVARQRVIEFYAQTDQPEKAARYQD